jgi:uncharacterized repeat protein (TIGR01451 family)
MFPVWWLRGANDGSSSTSSSRRIRRQPQPFRPAVEMLEVRWLPSGLFTVTDPGDTGLATQLRAAIIASNGTAATPAAPNSINFNITGGGPYTISPTVQLPAFSQPVIINGFSEAGSGTQNLQIIIDGTSAGANADGLIIAPGGAGSTIEGLVINNFTTGSGIFIEFGSNGNTVVSNYLGIQQSGGTAAGNRIGITINSQNNTVGAAGGVGSSSGGGNLISGNRTDGVFISGSGVGNFIQGNFIGTNFTGSSSVSNDSNGVDISGGSSNTVGGPNGIVSSGGSGLGNLISGNNGDGVLIQSSGASGNLVEGNFIGTDIGGVVSIANSEGVAITGFFSGGAAPNANTIGGTGGVGSGGGNLISGNSNAGVIIEGNRTSAPTNTVIIGNFIGTSIDGRTSLSNFDGILLDGAPTGTRIGEGGGVGTGTANLGNLISGNRNDGVFLQGSSAGNFIQGNFIGTNLDGDTSSSVGNDNNGVELTNGKFDTGNLIGGAGGVGFSAGNLGNLISGNGFGNSGGDSGVYIHRSGFSGSGPTNNSVQGNFIGTDVTGLQQLSNRNNGVFIQNAPNNLIGGAGGVGTAAGLGNLISGNDNEGVRFQGSGTAGNLLQGNYIGTDITGTTAINSFSGGDGVDVVAGARNNTIGDPNAAPGTGLGNVISGNSDGVEIADFNSGGTSGNVVASNLIGTNAAGTATIPNRDDGVFVIQASDNSIGVAGAGNVISGNNFAGIEISGSFSGGESDGNQVVANRIGTNLAGTASLGNQEVGIALDENVTDTLIGGSGGAATRNIISGNLDDGIDFGSGSGGGNNSNNTVEGNFIGTDITGLLNVGNGGNGISFLDSFSGGGSNDNTVGGVMPPGVGLGNVIAFNGAASGGTGVFVGANNSSDTIIGNSIFDNQNMGIVLAPADPQRGGSGGNDLQPPPTLTSAAVTSPGVITIQGELINPVAGFNSFVVGDTYRVELFSNTATPDPGGSFEGQTYLGFQDVIFTGNPTAFTFTETFPPGVPAGQYDFTTTATLLSSGGGAPTDTSPFSNDEHAPVAHLVMTKTVDNAAPVTGSTIHYTLTVSELAALSNTNATGVVVTDLLPAGVTFVSAVASEGSYNAGTGIWTVGTVTIGGTETLVITVTVNSTDAAGTQITNTATITAQSPLDPQPTDDTGAAIITVQSTPPPPTAGIFVTGADAGALPQVNVYNALTGQFEFAFFAFPLSFRGGVRVAVASVEGNGIPDIIVGAGPGGGPQVRVFNGITGQPLPGVLGSFYGLQPSSFTGGVFVGAGDVNGDGFADIIVGADAGGGPQVEIFSGKDGSLLASFNALAPGFQGGVRVAATPDASGKFYDIITGAGPGGGPQVTVYKGGAAGLALLNSNAVAAILQSFEAFGSFAGGIYVSGDANGHILASEGPGGSFLVNIYSGAPGANGTPTGSFNAFNPNAFNFGTTDVLTPGFPPSNAGVRVGNYVANGHVFYLTSFGPVSKPLVSIWDGTTLQDVDDFFATNPSFLGGIFVSV